MQAKLLIAFDQLSESLFMTKAGTIVAALTSNIFYTAPWLPQIPSLAELTAANLAYEAAYHAALSKDINKVTLRNSLRIALTDMLKQLAPYFELLAQGDLMKLETTGYGLRHNTTRNMGVDPLPAPENCQVTRGMLSGTLDINVTRLKGAASYELELTTLDPLIEENWEHVLSSNTATHMQLTQLTPKQTYWIRVRGIGTNGYGVWTNPLSIVVV